MKRIALFGCLALLSTLLFAGPPPGFLEQASVELPGAPETGGHIVVRFYNISSPNDAGLGGSLAKTALGFEFVPDKAPGPSILDTHIVIRVPRAPGFRIDDPTHGLKVGVPAKPSGRASADEKPHWVSATGSDRAKEGDITDLEYGIHAKFKIDEKEIVIEFIIWPAGDPWVVEG